MFNKKIVLVIIFFLLLIPVLLWFLIIRGAVFPPEKVGGVEVSFKSNHPQINSAELGDKMAWEEILSESKFNEINTIYYGNPDSEYIKFYAPIRKIEFVFTNEPQPYFRIGTEENDLSSASISFENGVLKVNLYINPDNFSNENVQMAIHNTVWFFTQEIHNDPTKDPNSFLNMLNSSYERFKRTETNLVDIN